MVLAGLFSPCFRLGAMEVSPAVSTAAIGTPHSAMLTPRVWGWLNGLPQQEMLTTPIQPPGEDVVGATFESAVCITLRDQVSVSVFQLSVLQTV